MPSGRLILPLAEPILTAAGIPAVGSVLTVYDTGTTNVSDLFSDPGLTQPITNPQVANVAGRFYDQTTVIWASGSLAYDVHLLLPTGESFTYDEIWLLGAAQSVTGFAPIDSPNFTGEPTAPTPGSNSDNTDIATTAFVQTLVSGLAPIDSPAFTGSPTAPTPGAGDNSTAIATTAFVQEQAGGEVNLIANGYAWSSNGRLEQWGVVGGVSIGQTSFTVPLPVTFDDVPFQVTFTNFDQTNVQSNFMNQGNHSTNSITLVVHRGAGATANVNAFTWWCVGKRASPP